MRRQLTLSYSGRSVTAIGLGAMPLSLAGRPDEVVAMEVIRTFLDAGGDFIDTANVYCRDDDETGHNERLVSKALVEFNARHVTVATKGGLYRPRGGWEVRATPSWLRKSCEKSLQDLKTDCIFLYQLHAPDPDVPLSESIGELIRLKEAGKIHHIGLSNVNAGEIRTALAMTPVLSVQNKFNILHQKSLHNGVVELCAKENITFIAHSPVGGHFGHGQLAADKSLQKIADQYGATSYQIALAWVLRQGDHILPIPGASRPESISSSLQVLDIELQDSDMHYLEQVLNK